MKTKLSALERLGKTVNMKLFLQLSVIKMIVKKKVGHILNI